jgi:2-polyprenyl-3-methyl-5-hydroxy-6-metoxy-1,4-benzoquinol methylase
LKIAGGQSEGGIVIGNTYDKYNSKNPIVRSLMNGFEEALQRLVHESNPRSIHEVGCGEGFWVMHWAERGFEAKGSDFSADVIEMARRNAKERGLADGLFDVVSIYDVDPDRDAADLIVCCEVLEHVEDPEQALEALQKIVRRDLVISVPREPLWRVLNMLRGRYLRNMGNTPGHLNHWSSAGIRQLAEKYFDVIDVALPTPWTMLRCKAKS